MEKKRQRRLVLSLAAGLVGAFLVNAVPERTEYTENLYFFFCILRFFRKAEFRI